MIIILIIIIIKYVRVAVYLLFLFALIKARAPGRCAPENKRPQDRNKHQIKMSDGDLRKPNSLKALILD